MKKINNVIILEEADLYVGPPEGVPYSFWSRAKELYKNMRYEYIKLNDEKNLAAINYLIASELKLALVCGASVVSYDLERLVEVRDRYLDASAIWARMQWVLANRWHPYSFGLPTWADLGELASPKVPEDMPRAEDVLSSDEMQALHFVLNIGTPDEIFFEALECLSATTEFYLVRNNRVITITQNWLETISNLGRQLISTYSDLLTAMGVVK